MIVSQEYSTFCFSKDEIILDVCQLLRAIPIPSKFSNDGIRRDCLRQRDLIQVADRTHYQAWMEIRMGRVQNWTGDFIAAARATGLSLGATKLTRLAEYSFFFSHFMICEGARAEVLHQILDCRYGSGLQMSGILTLLEYDISFPRSPGNRGWRHWFRGVSSFFRFIVRRAVRKNWELMILIVFWRVPLT